jgi:hypothetical protein
MRWQHAGFLRRILLPLSLSHAAHTTTDHRTDHRQFVTANTSTSDVPQMADSNADFAQRESSDAVSAMQQFAKSP